MPEISAQTVTAAPATLPATGSAATADASASSQDSSGNQPFNGVLQSRLGDKSETKPLSDKASIDAHAPATHTSTDPVVAADGKDLPPDIAALIAASQPVQAAPSTVAVAPTAGSAPQTASTEASLSLLRASLPAALAALRLRDQGASPGNAGTTSDSKPAATAPASANGAGAPSDTATSWPGLGALLAQDASLKTPPTGTAVPIEGLSAKDITALLADARSLTSPTPSTSTLVAGTATTPATATPPSTPSTPLPFAQPGWEQGLGNRVLWMVNQQVQTAELRMNPAHLGPLEVRISIQNDQASVQFVSAHSQVRDALQAAIPHLREMLGDSGLNLTNVNIAQHSFADARQRPDHQQSHQGNGQGQANSGESVIETTLPLTRLGLVDYYA